MKGRNPQNCDRVSPYLIEKHRGQLKFISDNDLRRICIMMLKKRFLKEKFIENKSPYGTTISVYLTLGHASEILNGSHQLFISDSERLNTPAPFFKSKPTSQNMAS